MDDKMKPTEQLGKLFAEDWPTDNHGSPGDKNYAHGKGKKKGSKGRSKASQIKGIEGRLGAKFGGGGSAKSGPSFEQAIGKKKPKKKKASKKKTAAKKKATKKNTGSLKSTYSRLVKRFGGGRSTGKAGPSFDDAIKRNSTDQKATPAPTANHGSPGDKNYGSKHGKGKKKGSKGGAPKITARSQGRLVFSGSVNGKSKFAVRDQIEDRFERDLTRHFHNGSWVVGDYEVSGNTFTMTLLKA